MCSASSLLLLNENSIRVRKSAGMHNFQRLLCYSCLHFMLPSLLCKNEQKFLIKLLDASLPIRSTMFQKSSFERAENGMELIKCEAQREIYWNRCYFCCEHRCPKTKANYKFYRLQRDSNFIFKISSLSLHLTQLSVALNLLLHAKSPAVAVCSGRQVARD